MNQIEMAVKTCLKCRQELPLSEFHRLRRSRDGRGRECRRCANQRVQESKRKRRGEMGEEEWNRYNRETVRRSRQKHGLERNRKLISARSQALTQLAKAHPTEYARLLDAAKYERGLL